MAHVDAASLDDAGNAGQSTTGRCSGGCACGNARHVRGRVPPMRARGTAPWPDPDGRLTWASSLANRPRSAMVGDVQPTQRARQ